MKVTTSPSGFAVQKSERCSGGAGSELGAQPSWQRLAPRPPRATALLALRALSWPHRTPVTRENTINKQKETDSFRAVAQAPVCSFPSDPRLAKLSQDKPEQTLPPNPCSLHTQLINPLRNSSSCSNQAADITRPAGLFNRLSRVNLVP